jgi:hypothetical protein
VFFTYYRCIVLYSARFLRIRALGDLHTFHEIVLQPFVFGVICVPRVSLGRLGIVIKLLEASIYLLQSQNNPFVYLRWMDKQFLSPRTYRNFVSQLLTNDLVFLLSGKTSSIPEQGLPPEFAIC